MWLGQHGGITDDHPRIANIFLRCTSSRRLADRACLEEAWPRGNTPGRAPPDCYCVGDRFVAASIVTSAYLLLSLLWMVFDVLFFCRAEPLVSAWMTPDRQDHAEGGYVHLQVK